MCSETLKEVMNKQFYEPSHHDGLVSKAAIYICPVCHMPFTVVNGEARGRVTFWMRDGEPTVTAHDDACEYRGKAIPDEFGLKIDESSK